MRRCVYNALEARTILYPSRGCAVVQDNEVGEIRCPQPAGAHIVM